MAKDPAFLFYPADASEDTQFMNRLERGAYFDLVKSQRMFHGFTAVELRKILGRDYDEVFAAIELVLKVDEEGLYYIPWVRESLRKRADFSQKQRERIQKRYEKSVNHGTTAVVPKKENENENVNESEKKKRGSGGKTRPTAEEILAYMTERNQQAGNIWPATRVAAEAKKMFDHYTSNGWKVGRNAMKDWQAAARNWMNNSNKFEPTKQPTRHEQLADLERIKRESLAKLAAAGQAESYLINADGSRIGEGTGS